MPKNIYFYRKKAVKLLQRPGAPLPERPELPLSALLLPLTDKDLSKYVFSVNLFYYF